MNADTLYQEIGLLTPEMILAGGAMALLMVGVFFTSDRASKLVYLASIALLVVAGFASLFWTGEGGTAFSGAFIFDDLSLVTFAGLLDCRSGS